MLTPRWIGAQREKWRRRKERAVRALLTFAVVSSAALVGLVALVLYMGRNAPPHSPVTLSSTAQDTIAQKQEQRAGGPGKPCGNSYIAADKTCHK